MNKISMFIIVLLFFSTPQLFAEECFNLPDKLEKCEPYKCQFKHSFSGEMIEIQIIGEENNRCLYIEKLPYGLELECRFSQSQRKEVAKSFKDTFLPGPSGNLEAKISYDSGGIITLDGKEVEDPLTEATNSGDCIISQF